MCIVLLTTAHPHYPLILLDNRDEYFGRPTSPASWTEDGNILSPEDKQRSVHGSWMGISRSGRLAVLTNFHEPQPKLQPGTQPISRGSMVREWLVDESVLVCEDGISTWREQMLGNGKGETVGGFSMILGKLERSSDKKGIEPLSIISNHPLVVPGGGYAAVAKPKTVDGLSNAAFNTDSPWPKVLHGTALLEDAVKEHVSKYASSEPTPESEESLIKLLEGVMKTDSLPPPPKDAPMAEVSHTLRKSIFIPPVGSPKPEEQSPQTGLYGTTQQTILLLNNHGLVTYIERTTQTGNTVRHQFQLEGWD